MDKLSGENRRFVLYEYLIYFWKKKWLFLLIPVVVTLAFVGGVILFKDDPAYTGKILYFTGSVKRDDLTHPNNIKAIFEGKLGSQTFDVFVSEKSQIRFKLMDDSKEKINKDMDTIIKTYGESLKKQSDIQIEETKNYADALEKRTKTLEKSIKYYKDNLDQSTDDSIIELIIKSEEELSKASERAYKLRKDLVFYEEPKLLSQEVTRTNNYVKESIIIGVLIGFVLSVAFLSLLKYLEEAKAGLKH